MNVFGYIVNILNYNLVRYLLYLGILELAYFCCLHSIIKSYYKNIVWYLSSEFHYIDKRFSGDALTKERKH